MLIFLAMLLFIGGSLAICVWAIWAFCRSPRPANARTNVKAPSDPDREERLAKSMDDWHDRAEEVKDED